MPFLTDLVITPIAGPNYRVVKDLVYRDNDGTHITVKAGFVSDGESGPEWFKDMFIEDNGYRQWAAFLHDAVYQAGLPRLWCDQLYMRALQSLNIRADDAQQLYQAVRLFGGNAYELDQDDVEKARHALSHLTIILPEKT